MLKKSFILISIICTLLLQLFYAQEQGQQKKEDQQKVNLLLNETTDGDYLLAIEKVGEVLQSAYINAEFTADVYLVFGDISQTDKNMDIILRSIKAANLNVRNQQMYYTVLQQIKKKLDDQSKFINKQDSIQNKIQERITALGKDKTILAFAKDSMRQKQFAKELLSLGEHYKKRISITLENRNIRSKEQSSHKLHRKNRSRERCYPLLP
ncbi:hypothetical protein [Elizabethkingia anophelis]|uniref:hypothetical protein n=1 Tax=Elizabethkingia anophelis TaxID=1117645 RepID=UPI0021A72654